jgi:hypothetical protein
MKILSIFSNPIRQSLLLAVAVMVSIYLAAFGIFVLTGFNLVSYYDLQTPLFVISVDLPNCPGGLEHPSQCMQFAPAFIFFLFLYFAAGFSAVYFRSLKKYRLSIYEVTSIELKTVLIGTLITGLLDMFLHNILLSPTGTGTLGGFSNLSKYGIGYILIFITAASFGIIPALAGGFLARIFLMGRIENNSQDGKNSRKVMTYLGTGALLIIACLWAFLLMINYVNGM